MAQLKDTIVSGNLSVSNNLYTAELTQTKNLNLTSATASKGVFTDSNKNLTTTGILSIAQGGTGATSLTNNRLLYPSSSILTSGGHYINNTKLAINSTDEPTDALYVNGSITLTGALSEGRTSGSTIGRNSFAFGYNVTASGNYSHAEGHSTVASNSEAHAEGANATASGMYSHAEGYGTTASGSTSHAEGSNTTASGYYSHAEGNYTTASGYYSHAEGQYTTANHESQHVFGEYNILDASSATTNQRGTYVEIVGNGTSTTRSNARTLDWDGNEELAGGLTIGQTLSRGRTSGSTVGFGSFAFGSNTTASDIYSHAEGQNTIASGRASHAEGESTIANSNFLHVSGAYNIESTLYPTWSSSTYYNVGDKVRDWENVYGYQCIVGHSNKQPPNSSYWIELPFISDDLFIVGNGTNGNNRSNAMTLTNKGNVTFSGGGYFQHLYSQSNVFAGGDIAGAYSPKNNFSWPTDVGMPLTYLTDITNKIALNTTDYTFGSIVANEAYLWGPMCFLILGCSITKKSGTFSNTQFTRLDNVMTITDSNFYPSTGYWHNSTRAYGTSANNSDFCSTWFQSTGGLTIMVGPRCFSNSTATMVYVRGIVMWPLGAVTGSVLE